MNRGAAVGSLLLLALLVSSSLAGALPPPRVSGPLLPAEPGATRVPSIEDLSHVSLAPVRDNEPGLRVVNATLEGPATFARTTILVTLPLSNASALSVRLTELGRSEASERPAPMSAADFDQYFGGSTATYSTAVRYFDSFGVHRLTTSSDRLTISFQATPAQVQAIFHTPLETYRLGSTDYYAPSTTPELPRPLAQAGLTVEGLSSYAEFAVLGGGTRVGAPTAVRGGPELRTPAPGGYLTPPVLGGVQFQYAPDFQSAYDEQSLFSAAGYPTNATVATILWAGEYVGPTVQTPYGSLVNNTTLGSFDPPDISAFYNETLPSGEPHPVVTGVPLGGAPAPGPLASWDTTGAAFENTLDLEMVGSTAPGARIYNVYGPTASFANLDLAFSTILNPNSSESGLSNVSVISNSWGGGDFNDTSWYQDLEEAQARGITVLAASGDSDDNNSSSKYFGGPDSLWYPASMAYDSFGDVAVGGTTVELNAALQLESEVAWNISGADSSDGGPAGSTGGISSVFPEPSWQKSTEANSVISGNAGRGVPDIAALANNTLMTISFDGYQYQATNASLLTPEPYYFAWGTSIACPLTAGLFAEIDHVLADFGNAPLGFPDPTIYALGNEEVAPLLSTATTGYIPTGPYANVLPTLPFFDVTQGGNYQYAALAGYDLVTGWGSLDAYNFTMYVLNVPSTGVAGRLSGVQDDLNLSSLEVTSTFYYGGVNTYYNASIQQNFFLANSLGAPIYWIQNVIYIQSNGAGAWNVNYTGWVVYPFYGLYPYDALYEYNFPNGETINFPQQLNVTSVFRPGPFLANGTVDFSVNSQTISLPVPGAAYIVGSLAYNYSWQGAEYSNGPFPDNPEPGGLSPQFGLVGGPSGGIGNFGPGTTGNLTLFVEPYGSSTFLSASTASFGENVDQTGESASNLSWNPTATGNRWTFGYSDGSTDQGVLMYLSVVPSFAVAFNESGLPVGTAWAVTVNGTTVGSAGQTIEVVLPDGSYPYTVSVPAGFVANPASGTILVSGASALVNISFQPALYVVSFVASGRPATDLWWVNITGQASLSSAVGEIQTSLVEAQYTYTVGSANKSYSAPGGHFLLGASARDVSVAFALVTFSVHVNESGLPAGTRWWVNLTAGPSYLSTATAASFSASNGTYAYQVSTSDQQFEAPATAPFQVVGAPVQLSVAFVQIAFNVTFSETGLPAGTSWTVVVNGSTSSGTSATLTFSERDGTFGFSIPPVGVWSASPPAANLTVAGQTRNVPVVFVQLVLVTINEPAGTPAGTTWSVALQVLSPGPGTGSLARNFSGSTSAVTQVLSEANGTFSYTVHVVGYPTYVGTGQFSVDGRPVTVTPPPLPSPTSGTSPLGVGGTTLWLVVGIIAAAAVVIGSVIAFRRRRPSPPK